MDPGLFERNEVLLDMTAQPHRMNVEVGHDDRVEDLDFPFALE